MKNKKLKIKNTITAILLLCLSSLQAADNIRKAAVAGSFYPSDPAQLSNMIKEYLKKTPKQTVDGKLKAVIVPHAGYPYSAPVAAYSFKQLENADFDTFVLIGLAHSYPVEGAAIIEKGYFETPLGKIQINEELAYDLLQESDLIKVIPEAHAKEHSIEVGLPFLQVISKNFNILPILMGNPKIETCKEIGLAIASVLKDKKALIICSTDMSHYPDYKTAKEIDNITIKAFEKLDPVVLFKKIKSIEAASIPNLSCLICGEGALYTSMYAARSLGADNVTLLKYANSGDTAGGGDSVVGYMAAALIKTGKNTYGKKKEQYMDKNTFKISEANQKLLLKLARRSIELKNSAKAIEEAGPNIDDELKILSAVFVTLNEFGELRGCIGTITPQAPLINAVSEMAIEAAFSDYRFHPVEPSELKDIHIEISVLSPMEKISSPDQIKPGVHGVVVKKGSRSGLFLPQVWDHFPNDKESFMNELCSQKAGLDRTVWKTNDVELFIFTVFSFEDK